MSIQVGNKIIDYDRALFAELTLPGEDDLDSLTILRLQIHGMSVSIYGDEAFVVWNHLSGSASLLKPVSFETDEGEYPTVSEYLRNCASTHPFDPVMWETTARYYLGTESSEHSTWLNKVLVSAVARAFNPGCTVNLVCNLAGSPGVRASMFWKILAGERNYATIQTCCDRYDLMAISKSWIVEHTSIGDRSCHKGISRTTDHIRAPYESSSRPHKRPSIIVSTSRLDRDSIEISNQYSRLVSIPVLRAIPLLDLEINRDRIWAAAVHAYEDGYDWILPDGHDGLGHHDPSSDIVRVR